MQKLHRPGLTLWHTFLVCVLVAMSTALTVPAEGYSEEARRQHDGLLPAEPVVLRKNGFVIYDSHERAEVIADLWNVGDLVEAESVLALLDRSRFLESKR